jgi:NAD(P)-dependent dehydrogenase (short-subunit alcohol dehydrogenase family)
MSRHPWRLVTARTSWGEFVRRWTATSGGCPPLTSRSATQERDVSDELFGIEGKVALVTGGSRGIGRMIAEGYVRRGAKVYVSSRKAEDLQATADELSEHGTCIALPKDLSSGDGCRELAAEIAEREERLDILVNNAGAAWGAPLDEYPDEGWDKVLDINVKAIFQLTQALLPQLRAAAAASGQASVINVGSIEGFSVPMWENYAYPASKAAVHQLTRHLAKFTAADGIRVNAIAPGLFPSRMTRFVFDAGTEAIVEHTPLSRVGEPDDMVGVSVYLASRASSFVTGAIIPVDGGVATTG